MITGAFVYNVEGRQLMYYGPDATLETIIDGMWLMESGPPQSVGLGSYTLTPARGFIKNIWAWIDGVWLLWDPADPAGSTLSLDSVIPENTLIWPTAPNYLMLADNCDIWRWDAPAGRVVKVTVPDEIGIGEPFDITIQILNIGVGQGLFEPNLGILWSGGSFFFGIGYHTLGEFEAKEVSYNFENGTSSSKIEVWGHVHTASPLGWLIDAYARDIFVRVYDPNWPRDPQARLVEIFSRYWLDQY